MWNIICFKTHSDYLEIRFSENVIIFFYTRDAEVIYVFSHLTRATETQSGGQHVDSVDIVCQYTVHLRTAKASPHQNVLDLDLVQ